MNEELAEYVAICTFKSLSELGRVLSILKEQLSEEEYEPYRQSLARICALISEEILIKIFSTHPELELKISYLIDKYGKLP